MDVGGKSIMARAKLGDCDSAVRRQYSDKRYLAIIGGDSLADAPEKSAWLSVKNASPFGDRRNQSIVVLGLEKWSSGRPIEHSQRLNLQRYRDGSQKSLRILEEDLFDLGISRLVSASGCSVMDLRAEMI